MALHMLKTGNLTSFKPAGARAQRQVPLPDATCKRFQAFNASHVSLTIDFGYVSCSVYFCMLSDKHFWYSKNYKCFTAVSRELYV